jgi:single-stranded-DNA-specific exonuclease
MQTDQLIRVLLQNRGIDPEKAEEFFNPTHPEKIPMPFDPKKAIQLIKSHIKLQNKIAIYGDYDVDGICSTAILWETLFDNYKEVFPHIPHRESEGYGLSIAGIDHCLEKGAKLIIAVDNGIVAHKEIDYCRSHGCDIIIIDHHEPGETLPGANELLHSTTTCAAALTWLFCREWTGQPNIEHLSLAAIAVICDIVPLVGLNRSFAVHGLAQLNNTQRPGLLALFQEAAISPGSIGAYEVGFIVGPRINAMGRLEHAIDSLRLLCTKDKARAAELALLLGQTNKSRQDMTTIAVKHALSTVDPTKSVLIVADPTYNQGIIGLIAAKLTEKYYRPSIAIAIGDTQSKASARSIAGFHVTDHIRTATALLVGAGGHAMAAGFTVENSNLTELMAKLSQAEILPETLVRKQRVDMELPMSEINNELYSTIQKFAPFGLSNPQPVFTSKKIFVDEVKQIGKLSQHRKLKIGNLDAMAFNITQIPESPVDIIYTVDQNTWNGNTKLQLIIKDIKSSS